MDPVKVGKVRALPEGQGWESVWPEVKALVTSSMLGQRMFGFAARACAACQARDEMEKHIVTLKKKKVLEEKDVVEVTEKALEAVKAIPECAELKKKRTVEVLYREWPISLEVASIEEELELRLNVALRAMAAQCGSIPLLPAEGDLCEKDADVEVRNMYLVAVKRAASARRFGNKLLVGMHDLSGDKVEAEWNKHRNKFDSWDAFVRVDFALVKSMKGSGGAAALRRKLLAAMPTAENPVSVDITLQTAKAICKKPLYTFASAEAQGEYQAALEILNNISMKEAPQKPDNVTEFLAEVWAKAVNYAVFQTQPDKSSESSGARKSQTLVGVPALDAMWQSVKDIAPKQLTTQQLEDLHVFGWALDKKVRADALKKRAEVLKQGKAAPAAAKPKAQPASKKRKQEEETAATQKNSKARAFLGLKC